MLKEVLSLCVNSRYRNRIEFKVEIINQLDNERLKVDIETEWNLKASTTSAKSAIGVK